MFNGGFATKASMATKMSVIDQLASGNHPVNAATLQLSDTVWDDLRVPALSTRAGASKIPGLTKFLDNGAGSQGILTRVFDKSNEEELYFALQLPHAWKQGTSVYPHVHWLPVSDGAANAVVSWGLEYSIAKINDVFPFSVIIYGNAHAHGGDLIAKTHYMTDIGSGISMAGIASVSPMIVCRVFRDATGTGLTDDYTADVALLEIDFHYEIDSLGSNSIHTK